MAFLANKVAVVTGASRGIGAAIAKRLARDGASVVVNYAKNPDAAQNVVRDIESTGGSAVAIQTDLTDLAQIDPLFAQSEQAFGKKLDILVNNAGWSQFNRPLETIDPEHYHKQMDLNVRALIFATQSALKRMNDNGRIINIGSGITRSPVPGGLVYCATKAAVEMITKVLAKELGPRKITVNCVSPGVTETDLLREVMPDTNRDHLIGLTPLGRLGQPEDIADVVAFVASDQANWITGEIIGATGGL
ncbi:MAG: glucose 1-dehydrogenase [Tepidisphaeraceae bacterium]